MKDLFLFVVILGVLGFTACDSSTAQIYFHRQKVCNKGFVRNKNLKLRYGQDRTMASVKALAVADEADDARLTQLNGNDASTKVKHFHIRDQKALATDRVELNTIGIEVLSSGEVLFTGILNHNGGVDGGLRGSEVTVRARIHTGVLEQGTVQGAPILLETNHRFWVFKNQPKTIDFGKLSKSDSNRVKRFFNRITHVEIELEHTVNR